MRLCSCIACIDSSNKMAQTAIAVIVDLAFSLDLCRWLWAVPHPVPWGRSGRDSSGFLAFSFYSIATLSASSFCTTCYLVHSQDFDGVSWVSSSRFGMVLRGHAWPKPAASSLVIQDSGKPLAGQAGSKDKERSARDSERGRATYIGRINRGSWH